jgi:hypothetical protein
MCVDSTWRVAEVEEGRGALFYSNITGGAV